MDEEFDYGVKKEKDPRQLEIERTLAGSDIVWPRYGSETTEELARKIFIKLFG